MYIPFNSRKSYHKSVFGALRQNESVTFRVVLPREMGCTGVNLVIRADFEEKGEGFRHSFTWERMEGESEEWWTLTFSAALSGLYMYYFECLTSWGKTYITNFGGGEGRLNATGEEFQLTVYDEKFSTPDWLKGGIIYQIFPDRFYNSGKEKKNIPPDRILRDDWGGEPKWRLNSDGKMLNNDYFGGDLKGIEQKLPYLRRLGISCIYLNPIFEANSNHRYDTADYKKIDSVLGDEKDFASLCKEAEKLGISIMLDGVFSHTGDDSIYFNKYGRYDSVGAYQSKQSPYYDWYNFEQYPDKYASWWGIDILPETNETNENYIEFITGKDGVARKWLRAGARAWRLDVADELPDKFLDSFRRAVKTEKSDAIVLGEVWEDASNKCSYGQRRRYLQGRQLDSVMNYPFADAILDFIRSGMVDGFTEKIMTILENYPADVVNVLMNHIGTHDTARAITALSGESCEMRDRQWQSEKKLTDEQYNFGVKLLKIASLIQFTLPGVPSIYYGDEAGMQGYKDPFNRVCYPWGNENKELISWYKRLGKFRTENKVFTDGAFIPVSERDGCVAYIRKKDEQEIMVIINRNLDPITYYLPSEWQNGELGFGGVNTDGGVYIGGVSGVTIKSKC